MNRVLIANRGEIAVRIIRSCKKLRIRSYAIFSDEDADAMHVRLADQAISLDGSGPRSYLDKVKIVNICKEHKIDAVIPGYGFLSEDSDFARLLTDAGVVFVGPTPEVLVGFGLKHEARKLAANANVPIVPGSQIITSLEEAMAEARRIGYPIMVKATAGGGGMGLQICRTREQLQSAIQQVQSRGEALFHNSSMFLEGYIENARHIEGQIFGNGQGDVLWFGERECSIQRRHQKVLEEAPSPFITQNPELREKLRQASISLAASVQYKSAGTIEYLVNDDTGEFFFLEMNTRLQVEHGVSELAFDVDIVDLMLLQASAECQGLPGLSADTLKRYLRSDPNCHAIEVRVYAEIPAKNFIPSPGLLQHVKFPEGDGIRIDTWIETGVTISPSFDPLLAKIIVHRPTRAESLELMQQVLAKTEIYGPPTNLEFLEAIVAYPLTRSGYTTTNMLETKFSYTPYAMEIIDGGTYTSVQDYPGRLGSSNGVPVSGPMDSVSFRIANMLVGNDDGIEGLEITFDGPTIYFYCAAVIAVCGADADVSINSEPVSMWTRHVILPGSTLKIGHIRGPGCRAYLAILGGFPKIAKYFGSKSTTPGLNWGGYQGRTLRAGDFIHLSSEVYHRHTLENSASISLPGCFRPKFETSPTLFTLPGPYDTSDYVTPAGRDDFYSAEWKVSSNSNRGGIRLEGPPPIWSRTTGGEGGSHPSNIMGYGYPTGGLSFTGDSAVIFPFDAPAQSGFVCLHVIFGAELWRLGQLRPGTTVKFVRGSWTQAREMQLKLDVFLSKVRLTIHNKNFENSSYQLAWWKDLKPIDTDAILYHRSPALSSRLPRMLLRQAGDQAILCEFGNQSFDMINRARLQQLVLQLQDAPPFGLEKFARPHTCSLLIFFDGNKVDQSTALQAIIQMEESIPSLDKFPKIPSRIHHLPLLFDAKQCDEATARYMETQRAHATYLPDNIDFIRRNNGLKERTDVLRAVVDVPHLLITSGRMPIFTQVDPRLRLSVPKCNPPRTFTPSGAVGTGGTTSSIYPEDAPGGYLLWGMSLPGCPWDTYGRKPGYTPNKPWLFNSFDQIIFHAVTPAEYEDVVHRFRRGLYHIAHEDSFFDLTAYVKLEEETKDEVWQLQEARKKCEAIEVEKEKEFLKEWKREKERALLVAAKKAAAAVEIDPSLVKVAAPLSGRIWKVLVSRGQIVKPDDQVLVLEAMKLEVSVKAPPAASSSKVAQILRSEGEEVEQGQAVIVLEPCEEPKLE